MPDVTCPKCNHRFFDSGPPPYLCPRCNALFEEEAAQPKEEADSDFEIVLGEAKPLQTETKAQPASSTAESAGKICPYCQTEIQPGEEVIVCPACNVPHHADCWTENGGCTTYGCEYSPGARQNAGLPPVVTPSATPGGAVPAWAEPSPYWERRPRPSNKRLAWSMLAVIAVTVIIVVTGLMGTAYLQKAKFVNQGTEALQHLAASVEAWRNNDLATARRERAAGEALVEQLSSNLAVLDSDRMSLVRYLQAALEHLHRAELAASGPYSLSTSSEVYQATLNLQMAAYFLSQLKHS